jgi:antitoxin component YwqK of YwqJK toxin-antitoxin module
VAFSRARRAETKPIGILITGFLVNVAVTAFWAGSLILTIGSVSAQMQQEEIARASLVRPTSRNKWQPERFDKTKHLADGSKIVPSQYELIPSGRQGFRNGGKILVNRSGEMISGRVIYMNSEQEVESCFDHGVEVRRATTLAGEPRTLHFWRLGSDASGYLTGLRSGTWQTWRGEGILQLEQDFLNNQEHGLKRTYALNGQIQREQSYVRGRLQGTQKKWSRDGKLVYEGAIDAQGSRTGTHKIWHEKSGALIEEIIYGPSELCLKRLEWTETGNPLAVETWDERGKQHGVWLQYYKKSGSLQILKTYKHGDLHGKFQENSVSGAIRNAGEYIEGERSGKWIEYGQPVWYINGLRTTTDPEAAKRESERLKKQAERGPYLAGLETHKKARAVYEDTSKKCRVRKHKDDTGAFLRWSSKHRVGREHGVAFPGLDAQVEDTPYLIGFIRHNAPQKIDCALIIKTGRELKYHRFNGPDLPAGDWQSFRIDLRALAKRFHGPATESYLRSIEFHFNEEPPKKGGLQVDFKDIRLVK